MMPFLILIWRILIFASLRERRLAIRRRKTYEAIRERIEKAHKDQVGYIQIDHMKHEFGADLEDVLGFGPPMYKIYRGHNRKCFISWDLKKMNEEISPANVIDDEV